MKRYTIERLKLDGDIRLQSKQALIGVQAFTKASQYTLRIVLRFLVLAVVLFLTVSSSALAAGVDVQALPDSKRTKAGLYVTAKQAYDLIEKKGAELLFVDVRTRPEVMWVGMPTVADANVPFVIMTQPYSWDDDFGGFAMQGNPNFVSAVMARLRRKGVTKNAKVLVMCRSGGRSARATDALTAAGFTRVYSVVDGFEGDMAKSGPDQGKRVINGWKNSGLPWSYRLDKEKMYLTD